MNNAVADPLAEFHRWTCPRCGYEVRFWSREPVPEYCGKCGYETGRAASG